VTHVVAIASVSGGRVAQQSAKSLIVVTVLFVLFRVAGKRELSQLNVYDLAMLMALSNAVQNSMTGGLGNLAIGLATSSTVVVSAWVVTRVIGRRPGLERRVMGTPSVLVLDGRILRGHLRREEVTDDELAEACRGRGIEGPSAAKLVALEVDGSISVIPYAAQPADDGRPRRGRRKRRSPPDR
jgi:uncharacterized membrane protein YcaP (DUF421 family)